MANISLNQVMTEGKYDFRSIYEADDVTLEAEDDSPFSNLISDCDYYEPEEFNKKFSGTPSVTSYFHLNCRSLSANWDSFRNLLC